MLGNEVFKGQNVHIPNLVLRHQENVLFWKYWKRRYAESAGNTKKMHAFEWPKIHKKRILYFVDHAFLYNLFQMKPTRCTLLLSIFISTSVHVSGNYLPIIRRTYCIYATLLFSLCKVGCPVCRPDTTHTEGKYQCRIATVSSSDDGQIVARNVYRSWHKYTKK